MKWYMLGKQGNPNFIYKTTGSELTTIIQDQNIGGYCIQFWSSHLKEHTRHWKGPGEGNKHDESYEKASLWEMTK